MSGFSFSDLNLSGVDVGRAGGGSLKPGRYLCRVISAELGDTRTGGKKITVKLGEIGGGGAITDWINVNLPGKEEATRIGREQLKALLTHGGHATPDKPGDIRSMKGLIVGVVVVEESYTDNAGQAKKGSSVSGYVAPTDVDPDFKRGSAGGGGGQADLDDEVPF